MAQLKHPDKMVFYMDFFKAESLSERVNESLSP